MVEPIPCSLAKGQKYGDMTESATPPKHDVVARSKNLTNPVCKPEYLCTELISHSKTATLNNSWVAEEGLAAEVKRKLWKAESGQRNAFFYSWIAFITNND